MVFAGTRLQPRLRGEGGRKTHCDAPGAEPLSRAKRTRTDLRRTASRLFNSSFHGSGVPPIAVI